jgi:hypothetical protein
MAFSGSQPRDEKGRWTSGNSGARLTQAAREKVALNRQVDARHYPPTQHGMSALRDAAKGVRAVPGHGMADASQVVAQHANAASVGTQPVLELTHGMAANSFQNLTADVHAGWEAKYGGMSARQHGAAARDHWAKADQTSGADRQAHLQIGNWHAQARESLTGRGMKV